jgi:hypothetical protein
MVVRNTEWDFRAELRSVAIAFERVTGDRLSGSGHFRYTLFAGDEQWRFV